MWLAYKANKSYSIKVLYTRSICSDGSSGGGPGEAALPVFLDQTEARRAEKNIWDRPHPLPYPKVWILSLLGAMLHCCYLFKTLKRVFPSIDFQ